MKKLLTLVCCILWLTGQSQINNSCDSIRKLGYGTFQAIVKYEAITEDSYDDYRDKNYQKIKKKYNAYTSIDCSSASCDNIYYTFLLADKEKYKYTLYHNKNKQGQYEEWKPGKLIKITFVRLNHFRDAPAGSCGFESPWLVSVVTDIEAL